MMWLMGALRCCGASFFCLRLRFFGGDFGAAFRNTEVILGQNFVNKEGNIRLNNMHKNCIYAIQSAEASEIVLKRFCKSCLVWKLMTRRKRL